MPANESDLDSPVPPPPAGPQSQSQQPVTTTAAATPAPSQTPPALPPQPLQSRMSSPGVSTITTTTSTSTTSQVVIPADIPQDDPSVIAQRRSQGGPEAPPTSQPPSGLSSFHGPSPGQGQSFLSSAPHYHHHPSQIENHPSNSYHPHGFGPKPLQLQRDSLHSSLPPTSGSQIKPPPTTPIPSSHKPIPPVPAPPPFLQIHPNLPPPPALKPLASLPAQHPPCSQPPPLHIMPQPHPQPQPPLLTQSQSNQGKSHITSLPPSSACVHPLFSQNRPMPESTAPFTLPLASAAVPGPQPSTSSAPNVPAGPAQVIIKQEPVDEDENCESPPPPSRRTPSPEPTVVNIPSHASQSARYLFIFLHFCLSCNI